LRLSSGRERVLMYQALVEIVDLKERW
jgi:hypothetical protein